MKKVFVYYSDDYYDNGGIGLEEFNSRVDAEEFIAKRMAADSDRTLDMYTVIEGLYLEPRAVEVAKVIRLDDAC